MDLFGEQTVQVTVAAMQTLLEAALVLTLAALLVLFSVRLVKQSASGPVLATVPSRSGRTVPSGLGVDVPSARWLADILPTRAPPPCDPSQRYGPSQAGDSSPAQGPLSAHSLRA